MPLNPTPIRAPRAWLLVPAWTVPGLLQFLQEATYARANGLAGFDLLHSAFLYLPSWWPWIPLSVWVARLTLRLRARGTRVGLQFAAHAAALALTGGVHLSVMAWVQTTWPPPHWPLPSFWIWLKQTLWSLQLQGELLAYALVVALTIGWDVQRRAAIDQQETVARSLRLERQLAEARLAALQGQLRPHFLFNALHSVQVMMREDLEAAETMLLRISDLLRSSLRENDAELITVAREMEQLDLYLSIELVRFGDRIGIEADVAADASDCAIPPWTLQPLAENALRHGLGPLPDGGRLRVSARRDGAELVLRVEDSGAGLGDAAPGANERPGGVGLANVRARLEEFFGAAASLSISGREPRGTRVEIRLPAVAPDEFVGASA